MVFTREDAARAAQTIGIDFKKEAFQLEDLLNGMNTELARHGTKAGTVDVTHDDPTMTAKLAVANVAGYILPKDATEDHPATLPADLEAIVWYMIAQQWAIIENDAAGLSAFSISDVSWTFDKNISETWQSVISKYQRW